MKKFWFALLVAEVVAVSWFYVTARQSNYFRNMPVTVRHMRSVESLVTERAVWLTAILLVVNASIFLWIVGVRSIQNSQRSQGVLALAASVMVFVCAGMMMLAWAVFGFAQW